MVLTEARKKRRKNILIIFFILMVVTIVMLFIPQIFNQIISLALLTGLTIAFFIKVLDWYEEGI